VIVVDKRKGVGSCDEHGEYFLDAEDSPCPACEDVTEYEVTYVVRMKARIRLAEGMYLEDEIRDIDIPENHQCSYVENSYKVLDVKEL
jgi:hypothetical protein